MGCLHSGLALWSLLLVAFGLWHMFGVQKKYGWLLALLVTAVNILVAAIVVR
ncbi:hypothetical protein KAR34_10055 [bacterium]|nr:hypothetical protein [bacterium]